MPKYLEHFNTPPPLPRGRFTPKCPFDSATAMVTLRRHFESIDFAKKKSPNFWYWLLLNRPIAKCWYHGCFIYKILWILHYISNDFLTFDLGQSDLDRDLPKVLVDTWIETNQPQNLTLTSYKFQALPRCRFTSIQLYISYNVFLWLSLGEITYLHLFSSQNQNSVLWAS